MKIDDIRDFLDYFGSIRGRTKRVAAVIPPDLFDWAPSPGRPSAYPGCGRELADGPEAVMRYLDAMHAEAMATVSASEAKDPSAGCARNPKKNGVDLFG